MYSNLEACRGVYTVFSLSWFMLYTLVINVLNVAWHLQVITRVNNVDKYILERTLI